MVRALIFGLGLGVAVDVALFTVWLRYGDDKHLVSF